MSFVKADVIYDCFESITFDDQNSPKLNDNGKAGIGFSKPENSKTSWLKSRLDKEKVKAGRKPFVPNQSWRSSTKEKSGWTKNSPKLNDNGKAGIGFSKPENSKTSWLKSRLDKEKVKAGRKPFVPNQSWRSSTKEKSGWTKVQWKRDLYGHHMKSKLNRSHCNYAQTLKDTYTGKTVKVVSHRLTQLQVMCSRGTVDNQLREACCVGNIPVAMAGSPLLVSPNSVSVAPVLQMLDEPSSSESSSDDISMNFADQDTAATTSAPSPDISAALNQLRASIDEIREQDDGAKHKDTILLHLDDFEKQVITRLNAQDRVLGVLRRDSNDQRTLLLLELKSSPKQLGTQIVTTGLDVVAVRRVVRESHQELNARINSLDEQVAATRNDLLEFSAQAQQTLNIITTQLRELVAYINRGGDNKKGESSSSRGPQPPPPPVDQIRGTGANVSSPDFSQRVEMAQRNIMERVMDTDRRKSLLQAERDRERRRRELSGSKRRRRH
ncbi:HEAT repeat-containing protein 5B [Dorcoceras hygrometricum]|uniref:HEAT repeat-containing protein 5B n=1 Tax=Dorcoceras hygrometricum TaxID=472368 RepID=A0A2Z7AV87_9LAMI|nr:HEAT repeat-containing protein 5B [Dorcoceras hygrometricum]